jgi:hypothetical protein
MFVRDADREAYERVSTFENLLRRVLRWELRGSFGRDWFSKLEAYGVLINNRIANEKSASAYNEDHSDLAYLDISELLDLIFDKFWQSNFKAIVNHQRLKHKTRDTVLRVRHKVAHFRSINQLDLILLNTSTELYNALKRYYETNLQADAYLSGEVPGLDSQLDDSEIDLLKNSLFKHGASELWDEYTKIESVRADGLSPGIGVVGHHVFFELFTQDRFLPDQLMKFAKERRFDLTYMHFGLDAQYVRLFLPLKLGVVEIRRILRSFVKAAKCGVTNYPSNDPLGDKGFDFGYWEHVGAPGRAMYFGFLF